MGEQAAFDFYSWSLRFPEFANIDPGLAKLYFNEAGIFCANDGSGLIPDKATQTVILNLLTAHIVQLNIGSCRPPDAVGRLNQVTEGSITAGLEYDTPPGTPQWYAQTKYGAEAYALMAAAGLHSARYLSGHPRPMWP
jgi:Protein of unknown function (DUF4054)